MQPSHSTPNQNLSPDERGRYARHLILPEVGLAGQERLKAASVICIGAGGLGSPLLLYLAAAGVGRIGIVDGDAVELSNLQRQVIHGSDALGRSKAKSAAARLHELNPHCRIDVHDVMLDITNVMDLIADYDVVCDGTDNFVSRYLINDACVLSGKPLIYGSVQRFEGQVSVFNCNPDSPNFRDLLPVPPLPGAIPSCSEAGVMGVMPGLIGLLQATETIKLITGIGRCLDGRLLVVDALSMRFRELTLRRDPDRAPIKELIDCAQFSGSATTEMDPSALETITVMELKALLERDAGNVALVDVRNPAEAEIVVIPSAVLIPLATIESGEAIEQVRSLAEGRRLFVHCKLGMRSAKAAHLLAEHGISATNVTGGIDAWAQEVDPMLPRY
ncbi:MAG: molybdopterin-synthase adenylyltransferase MoeB [Synechococcus sp. SP1 MAG]|jgi:adenylyltransferase/sulfurtransferase|nr:molybdopterin-synthase adenylyltransferase MoeB [Synechococcus sp. SP1 MAG]